MPFVIADRVRETTTTTGTGAVTLAGAYTSFQTFSAAIGNGNNTYYTIASAVSGEWEVGIGTYTSAGNTLSRDTVLASSNAGALVVFSAGTKDVFVTQPASRAIFVQNGGTGLQTSNSAFTANRVLYANAATTTTTSANLTFDGTNLGVGAASGTSSGYATAPQLLNYSASATNLLNASDTTSTIRSALYRDTTGGGIISMSKFRGTYASPTVVQSGDTSGRLWFEVWGGSNLRRIAEVGALVDTYTSDTNISGTLYFATSTSGNASSTEKMRLTAAGNLGINTTTPGYFLEIVNNNTASSIGLTRSSATARTWTMGIDGDGGYRLTDAGSGVVTLSALPSGITYLASQTELVFKYNSTTEGMRLTSTGLGIGTTSPSNRLDVFASADWQGRVVGNAGFNGGLIVEGNATGTRAQINLKTNNGTAREYYLRNVSGTFSLLDNTAGTIPFTVEAATPSNTIYANASGNIGIGTASPSNTAGFSRQLQIEGTTAALTLSGTTGTGKYTLGVPGVNAIGLWDNTASAYRWYVDSSGNLGIGTTSPGSKLTVSGDIQILSTNYLSFSNTAQQTYIRAAASNTLAFGTSSAEVARFDPSGNLGIGTTTPRGDLDVGTATATAITKSIHVGYSAANFYGFRLANTNTAGSFYAGTFAIQRGTGAAWSDDVVINDSGNVGIGYSSPAYRLQLAGTLGFRANSTNIPGLFGSGFGYSVSSYPAVVMGDGSGTQSICLNYDPVVNLSGQFSGNGSEIVVRNIAQFIQPDSGNTTFRRYVLTLNDGNVGIGTLSPGCRLQVTQAASAALGAQIALHNNASSAVGNTVEISFLTDSGASPSGTRNGRIRAVNENAGNGAANMQFWTWNGSTDAERMRLTSTGLGITEGNNPTQVLNLYRTGSTNAIMSAGNSNTGLNGTWFGVDTAGNGIVNVRGAFPLLFSTNSLERARIGSGGDIYLNGSTVLNGFGNENVTEIYYSGSSSNAYLAANNAGSNALAYWSISSSASGTGATTFFNFAKTGTTVGSITTNGTNTAYNTSSDRRLKDNIAPANDAGSVIDAIEVVKHDWKSGGHTRYGMIAQDLYEVVPEAVSVGDANDVEELKTPWGVDYSKLVPMLVKEIQSLRQRVAQLESK